VGIPVRVKVFSSNPIKYGGKTIQIETGGFDFNPVLLLIPSGGVIL
jgi:hypothetical protein